MADGGAGKWAVWRWVSQGARGELVPPGAAGVIGGVDGAAHHCAASPDMGHDHPHADSLPEFLGGNPRPRRMPSCRRPPKGEKPALAYRAAMLRQANRCCASHPLAGALSPPEASHLSWRNSVIPTG